MWYTVVMRSLFRIFAGLCLLLLPLWAAFAQEVPVAEPEGAVPAVTSGQDGAEGESSGAAELPAADGQTAPASEEAGDGAGKIAFPGPWTIRGTLFATLDEVGLYGASSPIVPTIGAAFSLPLMTLPATMSLSFEPGLDVRGSYYAWADELNRPVPIESSNRTTLLVSALLSAPVSLHIPLGSAFGVRVLAGPAFDLAIPLVAEDLKDDELLDAQTQTAQIASFVWGSGRFVHFLAGGEFLFSAGSSLSFGVSARAIIPLWRLWTSDSYSALDRFSLVLGLVVVF